MVVGLISDTHGLLRPEALRALDGSDVIVHAGDIGAPGILHDLRAIAPVVRKALADKELDLAVTLSEKKSSPGIRALSLLELPMVLLVEKTSPITTAEQLWKKDKIEEALICLPHAEAMCKSFQQGLARLGIDWFPSIEVSSIDLIETYVATGFGIGLTVQVPKAKISPNVRMVPLPGFDPVIMGALWRGKSSPLLQAFLDEMQLRAKRLG